MTALVLFDDAGAWGDTHVCESEIRRVLRAQGMDFGRWEGTAASGIASATLACVPSQASLAHLPQPFRIAATERLGPRGPVPARARALRRHYAQEHRLQAAEILHVVEGFALLYLHHPDGHLGLLCEAQDWIWLPAGTECRLLLNASADTALLRLLSAPGPWDAPATGAAIEAALPDLDRFVEQLLAVAGHDID